ncbi:MAG: choice-of-anchor J domain-containing protein [Planctomycetes bacterium]|nr:choice-of-anchor J domain-containing protein [Planctomycetota bacterium]
MPTPPYHRPSPPRALLSFLIVLCLLAGLARAQYVLVTPLDHPVSGNNQACAFDAEAQTDDLLITGLDVALYAGGQWLEIWTRSDGGPHGDQLGSNTGWTLVASDLVYCDHDGQVFTTTFPLDLPITAGSKRGLLVTSDHGNGLPTRAGGPSVFAQDGRLTLRDGRGQASLFGSTPVVGDDFEGQVRYRKESLGSQQSLAMGSVQTYGNRQIYFDLEAETEIVVTGLDLVLGTGQHDIEIWATKSLLSGAGLEGQFGAWRPIGRATGVSVTTPGLVRIPIELDVQVPAGGARGLTAVLSSTASALGTGAAAPTTVAAQDAFLTVRSGGASNAVFGGNFVPSLPAGRVHYRHPPLDAISAGTTATLTGTNGGAVIPGYFFDVQASDFLRLGKLEIGTLGVTPTPVARNCKVYALRSGGSYVGHETSSGDWIEVASTNLSIGIGLSLKTIATDLALALAPGEKQGFLILMSGSNVAAASGTTPGAISFADSRLAVLEGRYATGFATPTGAIRPYLRVAYQTLGSAAQGFREDFETATGLVPPSGWLSEVRRGVNRVADGWRWDNPGSRFVPATLTGTFAIADSDWAGSGNPIDCALISPRFDASRGPVVLSFAEYYRSYNGPERVDVQVWNGSTWVTVYTAMAPSPASDRILSLDLTAAAAGCPNAALRFRYQGDYDWYWMLDDVTVLAGGLVFGDAQRPQLSIGEFDLNEAKEANGYGVNSGFPGPYYAQGNVSVPAVFSWEGEPNQPVMLLSGVWNPGLFELFPQGQLDIGGYDPFTATFFDLEVLGDGTQPGFLNQLFRIPAGGRLELPFNLPVFTTGNTYNFQSLVFSSIQNIAITNPVIFTVDP